ncbi:glycosyltransferase family 1 protein [Sphingomonas sp. 28-63-12]|uniref:glycosyltransferase family 4 protein n=1 Tax=Sphingomonas sp. 28-63-12 TaxID=1970434 RepID=UPI000BCB1EAE|nr:MAG: glycosyl transferase family 1 [Sphingomonas sp. 28-63-12]
MKISDLRVALLSGNYNYTRDGANMALNRLVGFLLSQGAAVRIYSPVVDKPAFPAVGDLIGVPALPIPGRSDYRLALGMGGRLKRDLHDFAPNIMHISAPETLGHWGVSYARRHDIPVMASVHTRFDTYLRYYRLGWLEPSLTALLRRFYQRCDAIVAPSQSMAEILHSQHMNDEIGIWPSGVDHDVFTPAARSLEWRRSIGIEDDEVVVGYFGRLVLEKGLGVFCDTIDELHRRGAKLRVLVVGDGPAREWFANRLPQAVFAGFQSGPALPRALASMDILFNPSITETFGIVTLEALACGLAVVGADAPGTASLIDSGVTGVLVKAGDVRGFADAIAHYADNPADRAAAGAAGQIAAAAYSWDAVNRALADNYLRVIDHHATAGPRTSGSV